MSLLFRPVALLLAVLMVTGCSESPVDPHGEQRRAFEYVASPAIPTGELPLPSEPQIRWQENEINLLMHYGLVTFSGKGHAWYKGTDQPSDFAAETIDVEQWAEVTKQFGSDLFIFTAKHHRGFALWPTETTDFNVTASPYQRDVLREVADAMHEAEIGLGLYLSPWDQHTDTWNTPAYGDYYAQQLEEIFAEYGPFESVWWDGAKEPGTSPTYDWDRFIGIVESHYPEAVYGFASKDPHYRWVGNEDGYAEESHWSSRHGAWRPSSCDTPIRPHWFWRADEDDDVKSVDDLVNMYFMSIGRNCTVDLGIVADTTGRIPERDVQNLYGFRDALERIFDDNLAAYRPTTTSSDREGERAWSGRQAVDPREETFWTPEDAPGPDTLEIDLEGTARFNVVELREEIAYGQRVAEHEVAVRSGGEWKTIVEGTTIGYKRLYRPGVQTADRLRLVIHSSIEPPAISLFGVYFDEQIPEVRLPSRY